MQEKAGNMNKIPRQYCRARECREINVITLVQEGAEQDADGTVESREMEKRLAMVHEPTGKDECEWAQEPTRRRWGMEARTYGAG